ERSLPQHLTAPAAVRAQVWPAPVEIAATPEDSPTTSTGACRVVVVPSPSSPWLLSPQHLTAPAAVTTHTCIPPTEMETAPRERPTTSTGRALSTVDPSPSWPARLSPQHLTAPALVTAHVLKKPADTPTTSEDKPTTSTGTP